MPDAWKMVCVLPVEKLARFARPGAEPASITYAVVGSPPLGAVHVSVTELPDEVATRLLGTPGAVAAAEVAPRVLSRGAEKQEESGAPPKHAAKLQSLTY